METLMHSTEWTDLVIHLTEGAQDLAKESLTDAIAFDDWRNEMYQESLIDDWSYYDFGDE